MITTKKTTRKKAATKTAAAATMMGTPGGGGYGDPKLRNRDAVKADLRDGYISAEAAKRDYGLE